MSESSHEAEILLATLAGFGQKVGAKYYKNILLVRYINGQACCQSNPIDGEPVSDVAKYFNGRVHYKIWYETLITIL